MPIHAQTRLLRALQSGVIRPTSVAASNRLDVRGLLRRPTRTSETDQEKGGFRSARLQCCPIECLLVGSEPKTSGHGTFSPGCKDGCCVKLTITPSLGVDIMFGAVYDLRELKKTRFYPSAHLSRKTLLQKRHHRSLPESMPDSDLPISAAGSGRSVLARSTANGRRHVRSWRPLLQHT
jgi:hypothetical protein